MVKFESHNYITKLNVGSELKSSFSIHLKSNDENINYRKKNGLDVYNHEQKIGECVKNFRTWHCYLEIKNQKTQDLEIKNQNMQDYFIMLNELEKISEINDFLQKENQLLPKIKQEIVKKNGKFYYVWNHKSKGFRLKEKVHEEIRKISSLIDNF